MKVAMTNAAGDRSHQDFAILWLVDIDIFDRQGLFRPMKYGCFHRIAPFCGEGLSTPRHLEGGAAGEPSADAARDAGAGGLTARCRPRLARRCQATPRSNATA